MKSRYRLLLVGAFIAVTSVVSGCTSMQEFMLWSADEQGAKFTFKDGNSNSDTVYMNGVIYGNTLDDVKTLFKQHPKVKRIVMVNVPGSIDDEINLLASREIRKHGVATHIPADGMVASGGTDMFLAGVTRTIETGAKLGVHSWSDGEKEALDYPREHQDHVKYLDYYKEMGIPTSFYWYTLEAAPADDIFWMTPEDIQTYQVLTQ
ncbi:hypothetical protein MHM98_13835 [Psychrobium sp. MM17-31]|uniref:COG3904 family protein n=1 Tax=Psychrobium sp. MM17-31 TaxID=2917758 RepID=UPI001EF5782C|nr:hypothetical protein [Psychrobium sp. MM17-31]MCG7532414.1 hypothetical protein [Psychrobium sp. MM17-31]